MADTATHIPRFEQRHRMKLALEAAAVTKAEMADILGVGETTIRNYLSGRTEPPLASVKVWALRCGVPWQWVVTGQEPGPDGGDTLGGGLTKWYVDIDWAA